MSSVQKPVIICVSVQMKSVDDTMLSICIFNIIASHANPTNYQLPSSTLMHDNDAHSQA